MSKSFINRSQNQNTSRNHSNELQKKIDPQAQLDWINNQKVDHGFGVFNNSYNGNETAQMFAKDEKRNDEGNDASIQMKKDDIVWPIEQDMANRRNQVMQAKDDGFGDAMYQSGDLGNDFGDPPVISVNIGCTFGTGGVKLNLNFTVDKKMGDFTASYGFGVTYHSDFYETKKKGFEMRNSLMLDYDTEKFGASLGTNFWNGFGEMKEFDQRTGMVNLRSGNFGLTYENDGFPFGYIGLGDNNDSYRTAAFSIQMGDFSVNTNLLTGLRRVADIIAETKDEKGGGEMGIPLEGKGEFGEKYTHGFVFEQGPQYRYGGLTINYKGTSIGIDSDRWVRHPFQNYLAHDWIKDQRQFKVLSNDINAVLNGSNLGFSKFTTWGQ